MLFILLGFIYLAKFQKYSFTGLQSHKMSLFQASQASRLDNQGVSSELKRKCAILHKYEDLNNSDVFSKF